MPTSITWRDRRVPPATVPPTGYPDAVAAGWVFLSSCVQPGIPHKTNVIIAAAGITVGLGATVALLIMSEATVGPAARTLRLWCDGDSGTDAVQAYNANASSARASADTYIAYCAKAFTDMTNPATYSTLLYGLWGVWGANQVWVLTIAYRILIQTKSEHVKPWAFGIVLALAIWTAYAMGSRSDLTWLPYTLSGSLVLAGVGVWFEDVLMHFVAEQHTSTEGQLASSWKRGALPFVIAALVAISTGWLAIMVVAPIPVDMAGVRVRADGLFLAMRANSGIVAAVYCVTSLCTHLTHTMAYIAPHSRTLTLAMLAALFEAAFIYSVMFAGMLISSDVFYLTLVGGMPIAMALIWSVRDRLFESYQTDGPGASEKPMFPRGNVLGIPLPRLTMVDASAPAPPSAEPPRNGMFDVFLTHDWGTDGEGRSNHARVSKLNEVLKSHGLVTWFDEERMRGDIFAQMADGVDQSAMVVVFVTKNYITKVAGQGYRLGNDNCKYEFDYACRRRGVERMFPVVMEPSVMDTTTWTGAVGGKLGGKLYTDYTKDTDECLAKCVRDLLAELAHVQGGPPRAPPPPTTHAPPPPPPSPPPPSPSPPSARSTQRRSIQEGIQEQLTEGSFASRCIEVCGVVGATAALIGLLVLFEYTFGSEARTLRFFCDGDADAIGDMASGEGMYSNTTAAPKLTDGYPTVCVLAIQQMIDPAHYSTLSYGLWVLWGTNQVWVITITYRLLVQRQSEKIKPATFVLVLILAVGTVVYIMRNDGSGGRNDGLPYLSSGSLVAAGGLLAFEAKVLGRIPRRMRALYVAVFSALVAFAGVTGWLATIVVAPIPVDIVGVRVRADELFIAMRVNAGIVAAVYCAASLCTHLTHIQSYLIPGSRALQLSTVAAWFEAAFIGSLMFAGMLVSSTVFYLTLVGGVPIAVGLIWGIRHRLLTAPIDLRTETPRWQASTSLPQAAPPKHEPKPPPKPPPKHEMASAANRAASERAVAEKAAAEAARAIAAAEDAAELADRAIAAAEHGDVRLPLQESTSSVELDVGNLHSPPAPPATV